MAKKDLLYNLKELLSIIFFWVISFVIYDIIRFTGAHQDPSIPSSFSWIIAIEFALVVGFLSGVLFFLLEKLFDNKWFLRRNYAFRLWSKSIFYFIILLIDSEIGFNIAEKARQK